MNPEDRIKSGKTMLIHPATRLGHVHYTVAELDRQLSFYQEVLGLQLNWREDGVAGLGVGNQDLLRLTEVSGARRIPQTTGMYHFALLFPSRRELARVVARLFELRYPNAPTDHVVSKTTYLDDPEGNTIELYVYSQEDGTMKIVDGMLTARHADGRPSNGREPLDLEALFSELEPEDRLDALLPPETRMGHVHLYGANLAEHMHFYHDVLGFREGGLAEKFRFGDVGLDRPHVVAFNTWQGEGAPPAPPDSLGLRYFSVVLPDEEAHKGVLTRVGKAGFVTEVVEQGALVRDPSGICVLLSSDPNV